MTPIRIKGKFEINTGNKKTANLLWRAVQPEIYASPSIRSRMKMECKNTSVLLKIESMDSTSFRASMNSSLRWIKLALDIIKTIKKG